MLKNTIDKLLAIHFKSFPSGQKLARLENDVWQKIQAIKEDKSLSWQEKMFMAFSVPQFRMASVTLAVVVGLGVSVLIPEQQQSRSMSQELGLHVFASNAPYLPSTLFKGN